MLFKLNQELFHRGLVTEMALVQAESHLLAKKYQLHEALGDVVRSRIEKHRIEKELIEMRLSYFDRRRQYVLQLDESLARLRMEVSLWTQEHVLSAPLDGHVSLHKFWSDHQYVRAGDDGLTIVPVESEMVGRLVMKSIGSGRVKSGQEVLIKLDNYPYAEFGIVRGTVGLISRVPQNGSYSVTVDLGSSLMTSFGNKLPFQSEMRGQAEIVTQDLRLIERILYHFRELSGRTL